MQHLILLHGALGSNKQFQSLVQELAGTFQLHTLNLHGHGGQPIPDHTFSIELFSEQVARYIQDMNIEKVNLFGYSMGGYVGMYLAKHHANTENLK